MPFARWLASTVCPPAGPDRSAVCRAHRAHDVDEHAGRLDCWDLRYQQLGPGRFRADFFEVRLPGVQLFSETTAQSVRQRGGLGSRRLGMAFMRRSRGEGACNGLPFGAGALLACHEAALDLRTPDACELVGVVLDNEVLDGATRGGPLAVAPVLCAPLAPPPAAREALQRLVLESLVVARRWQRHGGTVDPWAATLALRQWRDELVDACLLTIQRAPVVGDVQRAQRRAALVERACARMLAQVEQQESISQQVLCHELGTSARSLAYAFQAVLGLSPLAWLRVVRLGEVRRTLRRMAAGQEAPDSIYAVATRHGFWHLGRFAVEYRQQFGERPTDTLGQPLRA